MTRNNNQSNNVSAVPFFTRYLEGQVTQELTEADLENINGGNKDPEQTQKYPSDSDEEVTLKHPSDSDEDVSI